MAAIALFNYRYVTIEIFFTTMNKVQRSSNGNLEQPCVE
jgi:hypothetical protein